MAFTNPLALDSILVDQLAGGMTIFLLIAFVVISILAARFRMPNMVFGGMVMVFAIFIGLTNVLGEGSIVKGVLLLATPIMAFYLMRAFNRI